MARVIIAQNDNHVAAEALLIEGVSPFDVARHLSVSPIVVDRINTRLLFACAAMLALAGCGDEVRNGWDTEVHVAR